MALTKIDDRGLKTPIDLLDNEKIRLGTGNDLEIFHNGTYSEIKNTTGGLYLENTSEIGFVSGTYASGEWILKGTPNASVELYYDNSKKLETLSNGIEVSGHIYSGDNNELRLGNVGSGGDLRIYHDGSHSRIHNVTGQLQLTTDVFRVNNAANDEIQIKADANGAVELFYDNSKKLETTSTGIKVTGINDDGIILAAGTYGGGRLRLTGADTNMGGTGSAYSHTLRFRTKTQNNNAGNGAERDALILYHEGWSGLHVASFPNGKVGIGEQSPDCSLHVNAGAADDALKLESTDASVNLILTDSVCTSTIQQNNTTLMIGSDSANTTSGSIIAFYVDGTEQARIADGISFNGDTASANFLNDYEEGTFSIAVSTNGNAPTISGTSSWTGNYTKIGKVVHVDGYIASVNVTNAGTGSTKITGLPFTTIGSYTTICITHNDLTAQACDSGYIGSSTTYFYPIQSNSTSGSALNTGFKFLMFTGTYLTDA